VVPQHPVTRAKYPFIDVHNHQNSAMPMEQMDKLVKDMDSINLQVMVNLSGGYGDRLEKGVANLKGHYKNRSWCSRISISPTSTTRVTASAAAAQLSAMSQWRARAEDLQELRYGSEGHQGPAHSRG